MERYFMQLFSKKFSCFNLVGSFPICIVVNVSRVEELYKGGLVERLDLKVQDAQKEVRLDKFCHQNLSIAIAVSA